MHLARPVLLLLLAAIASSAMAPGATAPGIDKAALESYLRHLELWPPQVQVQIDNPQPFISGLNKVEVHLKAGAASQTVTYYLSADGKTLVRGSAHNLDRSPFQTDLDNLKLQHQPGFGPAGAPVTLAVFSDFECPVCREEAKGLRQNVTSAFPAEVRVVFVDFPLDSIHPWAHAAAIAGRCVVREQADAFWDYHDWMFEHQPEINAGNLSSKVLEWARTKHLDTNRLTQCMDSRATESEVAAEVAMGQRLQVDSTPTLFLNGRRMVGNVPWQNLSAIIKLELEFLKHPVK